MYEIQAIFENYFRTEKEVKKETTDIFEQAIGAAHIYITHPECTHCIVKRNGVIILAYRV